MDVSIIIVNYNTCALLEDCLSSIFQYTHDLVYEVIVVDNASHDGSVEMIKNRFPVVKVIESKQNLGFGRANNLGFEYSSGRHIFLLNSDTLLIDNSIKVLADVLDSDKSIGAVGGTLIDKDHHQIHSYGKFPSILKKLMHIDFVINQVEFSKNTQVDYITGADLMIPRSVWLRLGGFDPHFFLYYEETDLQKRMSYERYKRMIVPSVRIIHFVGESSKGNKIKGHQISISEWKSVTIFKSMMYYMYKHSSKIGFLFLRKCLFFKYAFLREIYPDRHEYFRQLIDCINYYKRSVPT